MLDARGARSAVREARIAAGVKGRQGRVDLHARVGRWFWVWAVVITSVVSQCLGVSGLWEFIRRVGVPCCLWGDDSRAGSGPELDVCWPSAARQASPRSGIYPGSTFPSFHDPRADPRGGEQDCPVRANTSDASTL